MDHNKLIVGPREQAVIDRYIDNPPKTVSGRFIENYERSSAQLLDLRDRELAQNPVPVLYEIQPSDLRIDTYKQSGKGAWDTSPDTCVRITHTPTGVMTECCDDRSVHRNRDTAMQELQFKLNAMTGKTGNESPIDDKAHPRFMAGYDAGLKDGSREREANTSALAGVPVTALAAIATAENSQASQIKALEKKVFELTGSNNHYRKQLQEARKQARKMERIVVNHVGNNKRIKAALASVQSVVASGESLIRKLESEIEKN